MINANRLQGVHTSVLYYKTLVSVAISYFVNPTIRIQMRAYDLLSGTLTFLLFVILTPFDGAGSHAASVSVYSSVRLGETQPRLNFAMHKNDTTKRLHIIIVYI